jgi:hypothetical protein
MCVQWLFRTTAAVLPLPLGDCFTAAVTLASVCCHRLSQLFQVLIESPHNRAAEPQAGSTSSQDVLGCSACWPAASWASTDMKAAGNPHKLTLYSHDLCLALSAAVAAAVAA